MIFLNLFTFILFTFTSNAFKNTFNLYNKLKSSNKLFNNNILNNDILNNDNNIITDNFLYIISHHYECDDYFYQSYCDLHRIYKSDKEAFLNIYNYKFDDKYKNLHFKVVKYKINKINENEQFSEVLYDSYKHIINKNLTVINRRKEKKEDFAQTYRLYYWDN
jgi:hypothetical protein